MKVFSKVQTKNKPRPSLVRMGKAGREVELTIEIVEFICTRVRNGATPLDSAKECGITRHVLDKWLALAEEEPTGHHAYLKARIDQAEAQCANRCASLILYHAQKDWRAAQFWLKARRREDWAETDNSTTNNVGVGLFAQVKFNPAPQPVIEGEGEANTNTNSLSSEISNTNGEQPLPINADA